MSLTSSSMSRTNPPTTMAVAQPKPKAASKASSNTQQNKLKAQMHRRSRTGLSATFTTMILVNFSF